MNQPLIAVVDAFASEPFHGNPAGVCLLEGWPTDTWMQQLATEMHHPETAFLVPSGDHEYHLRWFTPSTEIRLCGHATLASAHILWETGFADKGKELRFHTRSGWLAVRRDGEQTVLDFPAGVPLPAEPPAGLLEAVGVTPVAVMRSDSQEDYILEVASDSIVRAATPDFKALRDCQVRMVILTARDSSGEYDIVSRVFVPGVGIDEDPVTGSAHTLLAPFWVEKLEKSHFVACQASERGGVINVKFENGRVLMGGKAHTLFIGKLSIDPIYT